MLHTKWLYTVEQFLGSSL